MEEVEDASWCAGCLRKRDSEDFGWVGLAVVVFVDAEVTRNTVLGIVP